MRVGVLGALHGGRARRRRRYQRVLAARGGVAKSAVAVFMASDGLCLDTRGKHERALSGLLVRFRLYTMYEYVRVVLICKIKFKRC